MSIFPLCVTQTKSRAKLTTIPQSNEQSTLDFPLWKQTCNFNKLYGYCNYFSNPALIKFSDSHVIVVTSEQMHNIAFHTLCWCTLVACKKNGISIIPDTWSDCSLLMIHSSMTVYSRAVATGPVSPVSTGPLFPSPMACLASPNRANARQTHMARTQRGDMLRDGCEQCEWPSLPTIFRSSYRTICEGCGLWD